LLKLEIDNEPCLLIVAIDITEHKSYRRFGKSKQSANDFNATLRKSELSLVKSNDFFKLFDAGISICTEGRKYLNVNEAFLKLYGFATKEEVIGKQELS
jgi:PAS domain-containing protein